MSFPKLPKEKGLSISKREMEVAALLGKGTPRKGIADELEISPRTVDVYLSRLRFKFSVSTTFALSVIFSRYSFRAGK
jgi:DNA-binding CsgD family transcriptional regulator